MLFVFVLFMSLSFCLSGGQHAGKCTFGLVNVIVLKITGLKFVKLSALMHFDISFWGQKVKVTHDQGPSGWGIQMSMLWVEF